MMDLRRPFLLLIAILLIISGGEVRAVQDGKTAAPNKTASIKKKKKRKKKTLDDDVVTETREEREQRLAEEAKHRARRKALAEEQLQNERVREHERRRHNDLSHVTNSITGSARLETRHFTEKKMNPASVDNNLAVLGELEVDASYHNLEAKLWNLGRYDFIDTDRSRFLPYEDWLAHKTKYTIFKIGMQIENWAMTEIFHPSDVFNSRNFDSDLENTEKIGEPAVSLRVDAWGGFATFFYMPVFWSPIFPTTESRLSAVPTGAKWLDSLFLKDGALTESDSMVNQYAFRYTRKVGNADLAFHYLNAIDRQEPLTVPDIANAGYRPVFLPVRQIGVNGSIVAEKMIYKFDVVHRTFTDSILSPTLGRIYQPDHDIAALGLERSFSLDNGYDLTAFAEWQKYLGVTSDEAHALNIFQNDVMMGSRLSFNDVNSKELKAYVIFDLADASEMFWTVNYNQKLSQNVKVSGGYRSVSGRHGATAQITDADHLFLNLTYFFER